MPTTQSIPFRGPDSAGDPVPIFDYTQQNSITRTATKTTQTQYGVAVSVSGGIKAIFSASLKVADQMEWTDTSSTSSSQGSTQSAEVKVNGPGLGYDGPTNVLVYFDTIYNTFLFAFAPEPPVATGVITDATGKSVVNAPVQLAVGSATLQTFTDVKGGYNFLVPEPDLVRSRSAARTSR